MAVDRNIKKITSVVEMRMLSWMCEMTRKDQIRNECRSSFDKTWENRLRCLGYVLRRKETKSIRLVKDMYVDDNRWRERKKVGGVKVSDIRNKG